jgi:thioredoxin-related protein
MRPTLLLLAIFALIISNLSIGSDTNKVTQVKNIQQLARSADDSKKIIMLEFASDSCSYCDVLENEIVSPMIISGDYPRVLIRKVMIDRYSKVTGFNGKSANGTQIASQYNVVVTPTLLFLNAQNEEVSERIIGVNSLDFFGGYVDKAIETGLQKIH